MSNLIPLPNKVYFAKEEGFKSVLVIEPLYTGYGMTIGNTLRRVLLSSLPGAAVTAVKIKGVDHEFSTIQNVTEDVVDIILNLKQLRLKLDSEQAVKLQLSAKGQKEVTAGMIKPDARVQIINTDLVIATLDNKTADLSIEITVEQGRGYKPVEQRESERQEIGVIAVDAIFTPIKTVNFEVENVRVGQITNYDKLTLTMETDGTITGREALDLASEILVDHFALLKTSEMKDEASALVSEAPVAVEEAASTPRPAASEASAPTDVVGEDLGTLGLSNRAYNALLRNNIRSVAQLRAVNPEDLGKLEGLGEKSITEINEALSKI